MKRIYRKKSLFNLAKVKINAHEIYIRILIMKFRWKYRKFDEAVPCSDIKPYAFIRVHNERPTLKCSLESILPAITRGIIAYNDCTDGSEEIILDFCRRNTEFIAAKYDYFNLYGEKESHAQKLTRYYNWVLSLMPKNEWLVKIDADQVYDSEKLKKAFLLAKTTKDIVLLPRIECHYDGNEVFILSERPFNFSSDHWVIFNDDYLYFAEFDGLPCEELLIYDEFQRNVRFSEVSNWHFALMKPSRAQYLTQKSLVRLDEWVANWDGDIKDAFSAMPPNPSELLDRKMLSKEHIMKYAAQFDL